ncbi:MAG: acetyl-CoA hydrolase, partial [Nocardioides sp.]
MRTVEIEEVLSAARGRGPGQRVVTSGNFATPVQVLTPLLEAMQSPVLHALNLQPYVTVPDGVVPETTFVGPGMRKHPQLAYVPSRLSMVPALYGEHLPVDVVVLHTTTPRDGKVSLGVEVNVLPAAVAAARARGGLVVAQMNPRMPWTFGDAEIDLDEIDLGVEAEAALLTHAPAAPGDDAVRIGSQVAAQIADGATLQAGIGEVPDATVAGLVERRGLRVW